MIRLTAHRHNVESMDFFPDSSHLVTIGGASKAIWIWDLRNPSKPQKYFPERPEDYGAIVPTTKNVVVSSNGEIIFATQGWDFTAEDHVNFLHIVSWPNQVLRTIPITQYQRLRSAHQREFVVLGYNRPEWIEIANPVEPQRFTPEKISWIPENWFDGFQYNSDDLDHFILSSYYTLRVIQISTKKLVDWIDFRDHYFFWAGFSSTNRYLVFVGQELFTIFETESFQPIPHLRKIRRDWATPCFTPDERYILFGREGLLHVVDIQTGEEVRCYDFGLHRITTMKISDDGLMVALAGANQQMVVVDLDL